jgi:hypothetical protein
MRLLIFTILFFQCSNLKAQSELGKSMIYDTITFKSYSITVRYLMAKNIDICYKLFNMGDSIFSVKNTFSKLVISDFSSGLTIKEVSTIPIDKVIIDEKNKLILVLTNIASSPYKIILYNLKGEILYRKNFEEYGIALDTNQLNSFINLLPNVYFKATELNLVEKQDSLIIISNRIYQYLDPKERKIIFSNNWHRNNCLFPNMGGSICKHPNKNNCYEIEGMYSQTDPFYEFIFKESSDFPTSIILNDIKGNKVRINCNYD